MIRLCTVDGCVLPVDSAGLCTAHRAQVRRGQDTRPVRINTPDHCHVRYCHQAADPIVPGWCREHSSQADPTLWERL